jgi:hypothetical protein
LVGNVANHQESVEFRLADFLDIHGHPLASVLLNAILDFFAVTAATPDHDAGPRRMDDNPNLADLTLNLDFRNPGAIAAPPAPTATRCITTVRRFEKSANEIPDRQIFEQKFGVVTIGVPRAFPARGVAKAVADGMNLATHAYAIPSSTVTVM